MDLLFIFVLYDYTVYWNKYYFFIFRYFGLNRNYFVLDFFVRVNNRDMVNVNYLLIGSYSDGYRCRYEIDIDIKIYDKWEKKKF